MCLADVTLRETLDTAADLLSIQTDIEKRMTSGWEPSFNKYLPVGLTLPDTLADLSACQDMVHDVQFRAFWSTFQSIRLPTVLPVLVMPPGGKEILYDLVHDAVIASPVTLRHVVKFTVAILINYIIAGSLSIWLMYSTRLKIADATYDGFMKDQTILSSASWRLDNALARESASLNLLAKSSTAPKSQGWHVNVCRYYHVLCSGILIRWMDEKQLESAEFVGILCRNADALSSEDDNKAV